MSHNKMLIDATHPEETRVVVLKDGRVEEFDYESAARKQLRGNIYLAKVTRVEPSLQAAFVDYGGNRHGFLAFSEIHPDYYQIPMADRKALLEEEAIAAAKHAEEDDDDLDTSDDSDESDDFEDEDDVVSSNEDDDGDDEDEDTSADADNLAADAGSDNDERDDQEEDAPTSTDVETDAPDDLTGSRAIPLEASSDGDVVAVSLDQSDDAQDDLAEPVLDEVDSIASEDTDADDGPSSEPPSNDEQSNEALDDYEVRPRRRKRHYKIQEVIKRRQVILIQVVKEERGNKGAALTTYLSLAGRYTVLMPNTARGGGISRKITNPQDRKRLKVIANELDVPEGMGLIVRTAGASRTKQELRRDFEYLLRLWESVRDLTLKSSAPSLVYEEGNLIKRSIRDLYNKELDEVCVAGEVAHKQAKDFMRMLMPSHAKNVVLHQKSESLFTTYGIERQLNAMFSPQVTLRSGGYLIINQTEALVAIDVNSGKATREFSIEETALATNLEAASEIARQLKLRDLAGLIVIDFIDMDERRNNRAVERRLKEALRHDRARIQFGRISHFGLLEMSRQRLRTGVLEGSTSQCPHCQGTGIIRSTDSVALAVLRAIEDAVVSGEPTSIVATTSAEAAIYILNNKRSFINEIEQRHGITVRVEASDKMQGANFTVGKVVNGDASAGDENRTVVNMDWGFEPDPAEARNAQSNRRRGRGRGRGRGGRDEEAQTASDDPKPRRRRRRRSRRPDRNGDEEHSESQVQEATDDSVPSDIPGDGPQPDLQLASNGDVEAHNEHASDTDDQEDGNGQRRPRRRRGRRGGNRERRGRGGRRGDARADDTDQDNQDGGSTSDENASATDNNDGAPPEPAHTDHDRTNTTTPDNNSGSVEEAKQTEPAAVKDDKPKPRRRSTASSKPKHEHVLVTPGGDENSGALPIGSDDSNVENTKRGWWSRRLGRS